MKLISKVITIVILSTWCIGLHAQNTQIIETNETRAVSVNITSLALSQYLFADTGQVFYDQPVLQSEVTVELECGLYGTIWHSSGFDSNFSEDAGDELDYYIGWADDIGPVSIDIGVGYFDAVQLFHRGTSDDTFYVYTQISRTFSGDTWSLTPYAKGSFYFNGKDSEVEGGNVGSIGIEYIPTLPIKCLSLPTYVQFGYDDGTFGNDHGLISIMALEVNWRITKTLEICFPSVTLSIPITVNDDRENTTVFGGGLRLRF